MKRTRRNFTGQDKVAVLRRHLVEKVPVSELCDEAGLQPAQFCQWQKQLFEQGAVAFEWNGKPKVDKAQERIAALEARLRRKDEVLGEPHGGASRAKKGTWGTLRCAWVPLDTRDAVMDFVNEWSDKAEISLTRFVGWRHGNAMRSSNTTTGIRSKGIAG